MTRLTPLRDIARVIRSKNAGPFEVTFDVVFKDRADFDAVRTSGVLTREVFARLYGVPSQSIITFEYFGPANALKVTIPRPRPQGSIGETDMHAAQQHVPLMQLMIPWQEGDKNGRDAKQ